MLFLLRSHYIKDIYFFYEEFLVPFRIYSRGFYRDNNEKRGNALRVTRERVESPRFVHHFRRDFRPADNRALSPSPSCVKLERDVPIDRPGMKPAPIRSKLLLISPDSSPRLGE